MKTGSKFIARLCTYIFVLTLILTLLLAWMTSSFYGIGVIVGVIWGCANLYFLHSLTYHWLIVTPRNYRKIHLLFASKFLLLYGVGYLLLRYQLVAPSALFLGFSFFLLLLCLLALLTLREQSFSGDPR